jgi:GT2 family glycosyltransferase
MTATISVLICTAGRPGLLERAIESLLAGTRLPDQLVLVNGGGDEANEVVGRHAASFPEVVLLQYQNQNLAVSRNLGLPECRGDIVAMTDDDAVVSPTWLEALARVHMEEPRAGAVGGPAYGSPDGGFLSRIADQVVFPSFPARRTVRTLPGVNIAYKRQAILAVGRFDESLFRGEDVDFNWRAIRHGYDIVYDPAIEVRHEHRSTVMGLLRQQWMYGRAYVLVRRKWRDMYCVYPYSLRSVRDWAKLAYCAAAVLLHPLAAATRMRNPVEAVAAYPLLVAHHLTWKTGMLAQMIRPAPSSASPSQRARAPEPPITLRRRWVCGQTCDAAGVSAEEAQV